MIAASMQYERDGEGEVASISRNGRVAEAQKSRDARPGSCSPGATLLRVRSSGLGEQPALATGQEAEGALLLEVQGADRGGGDAAEAAAEIRDGGADRRLGQYPQAERQ